MKICKGAALKKSFVKQTNGSCYNLVKRMFFFYQFDKTFAMLCMENILLKNFYKIQLNTKLATIISF